MDNIQGDREEALADLSTSLFLFLAGEVSPSQQNHTSNPPNSSSNNEPTITVEIGLAEAKNKMQALHRA